MKCSNCGLTGHNKRTCTNDVNTKTSHTEVKYEVKEPIDKSIVCNDSYGRDVLKTQYRLHKDYVVGRIKSSSELGIKIRLPSIPEDISENIVKFILYKLGDTTCSWDCKKGDLISSKEGKIECKCFTSDGPCSFTPSSDWNVIYFLDARNWLNDEFVLYRVPLSRTSKEWKSIKVNKKQTFEDQCTQGRRPRLTWVELHNQLSQFCDKKYNGRFDDIFH